MPSPETRRRGCGHQHQLSAAVESRVFEQVQTELRADRAALLVEVFGQVQLGGNRFNGQQGSSSRNVLGRAEGRAKIRFRSGLPRGYRTFVVWFQLRFDYDDAHRFAGSNTASLILP